MISIPHDRRCITWAPYLFCVLSRMALASLSRVLAADTRRPGVVRPDPVRSTIRPLDDDLAELDHWRDVGVVGEVAPDLGAVLLHGGLVAFGRITDESAHRHVSGRCTSAGHASFDGVVSAGTAQPSLHHRHVPVAVVGVVEARAFAVWVHHVDLDHAVLHVIIAVVTQGVS